MDASLLLQSNKFVVRPRFATRAVRGRQNSRVLCALTSPTPIGNAPEKLLVADPVDQARSTSKAVLESTVSRTAYKDSWFDVVATNHLSQSVQAAIGIRNEKKGYESLVEAARAVYKNFNTIQQRELVIVALDRAFPRPILNLIRTMLPNPRVAREFFAAFTTIFFAWLVGPCEVKESDQITGEKEWNVVYIKKCRFLEESNCVGMCLNLCKVPSQTFIKNSLGVPVDMVPNFDDMSCEMVFGKEPLEPNDDPAFKQPCYKLCKAKQQHVTNCID